MHSGVLVWVILLAIFSILFFGIAGIVSWKGVSDIKELMNDPELSGSDD